MATTVKRDPFARGEYKRFCKGNAFQEHTTYPLRLRDHCQWCGEQPARLYAYIWWPDDKPEPKQPDDAYYCNFGCFQAYNS